MSSNTQRTMLNNLGLELSRGIWYRIRNIKYDILINGIHYNRFTLESVSPGMCMFKKTIYIPVGDLQARPDYPSFYQHFQYIMFKSYDYFHQEFTIVFSDKVCPEVYLEIGREYFVWCYISEKYQGLREHRLSTLVGDDWRVGGCRSYDFISDASDPGEDIHTSAGFKHPAGDAGEDVCGNA